MRLRHVAGCCIGAVILCLGEIHGADYATLHKALIKFYGYQRSGLANNQNPYNPFYTRTPYPHGIDNLNGSDMSGGWYDAGDFVKFGLPQGYSTYCLLKGYDVFPAGYDDLDSRDNRAAKDGIPDVLNEAKVATDYLMKAVVSDKLIVVDVGNAFADHQQWVSGYQSTAARTVYTNAGADVAGLYAAALALMSIVYRKHDAAYADACLLKAKEAFKFGLLNQKLSVQQRDPSLGNSEYYSTKTFKDKMACGAIELYRATKEANYLTWAKTYQSEVKSHYYVLGYANCGDLSAFELYRQGQTDLTGSWLSDVDLALNRVVTASNASALIKGAYINSDWGTARDAANAAFSAALAYMVRGDKRYRDFAIQQISWVAGFAPFTKSYVVNYNSGPRNPHHRNSSTLGIPIPGGIVSGPTPNGAFDPSKPENSSWSFTDSREIYKNTEVAIDYNAAAVGAVAFIRDYMNPPPGLVRIEQPLLAKPDPVDLNTSAVTLTMQFEKAIAWKIVLTGRSSKAGRSFSGSGQTLSLTWNGESDSGSFMSGETVDARLVNDAIAVYHQSLSSTSFYLASMKKEVPKVTDILVDDFDDGNMVNAFSGTWTSFNDQALGGASYTIPTTLSATAITASGESNTKALLVRFVGRTGASQPHAGVRTVFNAAGSVVNVGTIGSIMVDVKAGSDSASLRLELEQSDIADGAFFGATIYPPTGIWTRIRVPISSFTQPAWKTQARQLNLKAIKSLRFTYYGTGSIQVILDNVRIEGLSLSSASAFRFGANSGSRRLVSGITDGKLRLEIPSAWDGNSVAISLLHLSGAVVARRTFPVVFSGADFNVSAHPLAAGLYMLIYRVGDRPSGTMTIAVP